MTHTSESSIWARTMIELSAIGDRLTNAMRERGQSADGAVYLTILGSIMDVYLNRMSNDVDHPTFVPCCGYFQHLGSPNPDTVYRRAPVDDRAAYRLSGDRGTARQVTIMAFTQTMQGFAPLDLSDIARGRDRHFDVILSPERPTDHRGDWWQLPPGTASLWVRSLSDRWGQEQEPRMAIERLGVPSGQRQKTETITANLANLASLVDRTVTYGIEHTDGLYQEGVVNRLKMADYTSSGAMPAQWYHEGMFDLSDDDALIVEARLPEDCDYFSWSLTDRMLVTLDWTHAQTSLNRTQAAVDDDGVLRVVVAKSDPGIRNWMDTTGYGTGVLQCRAIGSAQPPSISTQVTTLTSVLDHLPASTRLVTRAEREQALQERKTGFQLRQLW